MKLRTRILSLLLTAAMLFTILPLGVLAAETGPLTLSDGYITVSVSRVNGGFTVQTGEGSILKKSDNNKNLLYHSGNYDTSFLSFEVTDASGNTEQYLFGGKYGPLTDPSRNGVSVTGNSDAISAVWSVGSLTFTETISLANAESAEHGMVSLGLNCRNSGEAVSIKARVLLDTALGAQDWGVYQVQSGNGTLQTVTTEQIVTGADLPQNFYAVDDVSAPGVEAFSVNSTIPYQAAFGHWNNLAATLFDFTPSGVNFTNSTNEYLTADSAYALYFDMGSVGMNGRGDLVTYYGVYSDSKVSLDRAVSVNTTAPLRLELNGEKTAFIRQTDVGSADFSVSVNAENYAGDAARDYSGVVLAVRSTSGLCSLSDGGEAVSGVDFMSAEPFTIAYDHLNVGEKLTKTLYFKAKRSDEATYERITIGVYSGEVTAEKLLGEKVLYILLPGSDGNIPKVNFASMSPTVIYTTGTRHLYAAVTSENILTDRGNWTLYACSADGKTKLAIPHQNITIQDGVMDVALTEAQKTPAGSWYLQLEWTDAAITAGIAEAAYQVQTAPALHFTVSEDPKFKNDTYGVLAAVKYGDSKDTGKITYRLRSFADEAEFEKFKGKQGTYASEDYSEILLIFRGEFTADKRYIYDEDANGLAETATYFSAVSTKTLDETTRTYTVDNGITINSCVDFEGGSIAVYYEHYDSQAYYAGSPICVEFDGELYTSDARTSVWKGKAILTKLEQGSDISLIPYDENGERDEDFHADTISIVWPNAAGIAQSILGMAFKMAYGTFGVMKDDDEELGRVLAFSAGLDLDFMSPGDDYEEENSYFGKMKGLWELWHDDSASLYRYAYDRGRINKMLDFKSAEEPDDDDKEGVAASVMVEDILFGCGEGFVGLHFKVKVGVQNYIDKLPKIEGELEVNTINDWSFGFEGEMELAKFSLEAHLKFKSKDNIPVPDEIYFYMGGFEPGLNVDGTGVLWLKGGGGGIKDLYDTIFLTDTLPPLRLMLSLSFSIIQILDGRCDLEVGLTGFELKAKDLKIKGEIEAIEAILLSLDWYPSLELKAGISVDLFSGVIEGQGYIVLIGDNYSDWFFEMFAHAAIKIPKSVPLVGGIALFGADLGISTERIWGAIEVIGIGVGITYYWGEHEVNFGSAKDKAKPTFPSLLELDGYEAEYTDIPMYYDAETDRTLYAHVGTNFDPPVLAQVITADSLVLQGTAGYWSDDGQLKHRFNLGGYVGTAEAIQLSYTAASEAEARSLAEQITVSDAGGSPYTLKFYDPAHAMEDAVNAGTNANVSFDETSGTATCSFTMTDPACYGKDWDLTTPVESSLLGYTVQPLPKLTGVSGENAGAGSLMEVEWTGSGLWELDQMSFYLTLDPDGTDADGMYLLGCLKADDGADLGAGTETFYVPDTVPTGSYYLRAVYAEDEMLNGVLCSAAPVQVTNANQPEDIPGFTAAPGGDLQFEITVPETGDAKTTGYFVSVYPAGGGDAVIANLNTEKAESGSTVIRVGGSYVDSEGTERGLEGGESYQLGVTPYHLLDTDGDGEADKIVRGKEKRTDELTLPAMTTPTLTVSADCAANELSSTNAATGESWVKTVYTADSITFTADASEAVTGTWELDGVSDAAWRYTNTGRITAAFTDLTDGDHRLTFRGRDGEGDSFRENYDFTVDTAAPRLMLTSPLNGSFAAADGTVTVSGITDAESRITVLCDGTAVINGKPVRELDGGMTADGIFSFDLTIPDYNAGSTHAITVLAADAVGNRITRSAEVSHRGLTDIVSLEILADDAVPQSGNLAAKSTAQTIRLQLLGVTSDGTRFVLDGSNVFWTAQAAEGTASVTADGELTLGALAQGFVTGKLEVATGAFRSASLSFGTSGSLDILYTLGGTVTGGEGLYAPGDAVTLTAVPDEGYLFDHWEAQGMTLADAASAKISFTLPEGSVTVKAVFMPKPIEGTVTVMTAEGGTVTGQLDSYHVGDTVTLTAVPDSDYEFDHWEVQGITLADASSAEISFTLPDGGVTLQPVFKEKLPEPVPGTVTIAPAEGGTVTGLQESYHVGDTVTLTAVPDAGYEFDHWDVQGVTLADASSAEISFILPEGGVSLRPVFRPYYQPTDETGSSGSRKSRLASAAIPAGVDENAWLPYYLDAAGKIVYVAFSAPDGGRIIYLPPEAEVHFRENRVTFTDMPGHWAEPYVDFIAAREIFRGVGNDRFDPDGTMTRAMFVTVLHRLLGSPAAKRDCAFTDVAAGSWYAAAVAWAAENGVVMGVSDDRFAPDDPVTREQMCALICRFLRAAGYEIPETEAGADFTDASAVSAWAAADVAACQRMGLIGGYPDGSFRPQGKATRAENCVVLERMICGVLEALK